MHNLIDTSNLLYKAYQTTYTAKKRAGTVRTKHTMARNKLYSVNCQNKTDKE